jgi:hypothetical protein
MDEVRDQTKKNNFLPVQDTCLQFLPEMELSTLLFCEEKSTPLDKNSLFSSHLCT